MKKFLVKNKKEMAEFAKDLAKNSKKGDIFGLFGTLGAGKSFFAKNFINFLLEEKKEILSPTFNLVYSYDSKKSEIFHFDLYRLKSIEELENIGFFDAISSGICLIEWPEIAEELLRKSKNFHEIKINFVENNNSEKNCDEFREIIINDKKV
jgi:tRNA threonylcarbamoyl adenosine modification protein YjeE